MATKVNRRYKTAVFLGMGRDGKRKIPLPFYIKKKLDAAERNGIYVTDLMGLHAGVNAVTGDFSVEASGFVIEDGKKGRPVKTFTIAGNFFELLKNIVAVSDTVKIGMGGFTAFGAPAVLVHSINVAG